MIKTGDVVHAFRAIWPKLTEDMVRAAAEEGILKVNRPNPFTPRGAYDYDPDSLKEWLDTQPVPADKKQEALHRLGIHFQQLHLLTA